MSYSIDSNSTGGGAYTYDAHDGSTGDAMLWGRVMTPNFLRKKEGCKKVAVRPSKQRMSLCQRRQHRTETMAISVCIGGSRPFVRNEARARPVARYSAQGRSVAERGREAAREMLRSGSSLRDAFEEWRARNG